MAELVLNALQIGGVADIQSEKMLYENWLVLRTASYERSLYVFDAVDFHGRTVAYRAI